MTFRFGECVPRSSEFIQHAFSSLVAFTFCCGTLGVLFFLDAKQAVIAFVGVAVIGWLITRTNTKVDHFSQLQMPMLQNLTQGIQRVTGNWFLVKALRTDRREYQHLTEKNRNASHKLLTSHVVAAIGAGVPSFLGIVLLCILLGVQLSRSESSGSDFIPFLYVLTRMVQWLSILANAAGKAATHYAGFKEALEALNHWSSEDIDGVLGSDKEAHCETTTRAVPQQLAVPDIEFRDVDFSYDSAAPAIIEGINLNISPKTQVGLVGPNGAGKSTVLALLMGFLKPSSGSVLIAGEAPEVYFRRYPLSLGYVGPEPYLIEGTLEQNLLYGLGRDADPADLEKALKLSKFDAVVRQKEAGLEYRIEENSAGLSAGEKQRLALARALLRDPKVLILDEVSANLDDDTEVQIVETLAGLKSHCTCLIVSHRPGVIRHVDSLYRLEAGRLVKEKRKVA